jgi:hypothetical protein
MDRGQHRRFAAPGHAERRERDTGQFVVQDLQSGKEVLEGDGAKLLRQPRPREVRDRQGSDPLPRGSRRPGPYRPKPKWPKPMRQGRDIRHAEIRICRTGASAAARLALQT